MIKLQIGGRNYELTEKVKAYAQEKIGMLDRYLPRNQKQVEGRVTLAMDPSGREDNQCVCEVILEVPKASIQAKEATINMFAAIDIVEAKLKMQILKHKEKTNPKRGREFIQKLLGRGDGL